MSIICKHGKAVTDVLKSISKKYFKYKNFCDLGCGEADKTIIFEEPGRILIGIDWNRLNYNSEHYKKINFCQGSIFDNGFAPEYFDMILCYDVIEHMEEPNKLLAEIHRLLKKDGICILSTPNKYRLLGALLIFLGIRKFPFCLDEKNKEKYPEYWHIREYSTKELKKQVENIFKIEKFYKVFYGYTGSYGFKFLFNLPFYHNSIIILRKK